VAAYIFMPPSIWLVNRPKSYLMAFIFALLVSGIFAVEGSLFHIGIALAFGVLGYAMRYFKFPFLPMVLGVVLGFMVESNFRRALVISGDEYMAFLQDPISLGLLSVAVVFILGSWIHHLTAARKSRKFAKAAS
jgi:putative tricarboxylic transport membrane protein